MGKTEPSVWFAMTHWHAVTGGIVVALVTVVIVFALGGRLTARSRRLAFAAGVVGVGLVSSELNQLAMTDYPDHMAEHLIVILVIAPLLAGALPVRWTRPAATIGFLAFTAVIPTFHLTPLGGVVMRSSLGHDVEMVSFLLVGTAFWLAPYGPRSELSDRQRTLYVLLALPVVATTGIVLWSSTAPSLATTSMNMAMVTLGDVHAGGIVMMEWGSTLMGVNLVLLGAATALESRRHFRPIGQRYA